MSCCYAEDVQRGCPMSLRLPSAFLLAVGAACVPEGPAVGNAPASSAPPAKSSPVTATARSESAIASAFEDRFERTELGPDYNALSPRWKIESGRLCARGAKN